MPRESHSIICIYIYIIYICVWYIYIYILLYYIILYYIILYYTILFFIILYYITLYYIILYYIVLYYIILYCIVLYYIISYYIISYYIILYYIYTFYTLCLAWKLRRQWKYHNVTVFFSNRIDRMEATWRVPFFTGFALPPARPLSACSCFLLSVFLNTSYPVRLSTYSKSERNFVGTPLGLWSQTLTKDGKYHMKNTTLWWDHCVSDRVLITRLPISDGESHHIDEIVETHPLKATALARRHRHHFLTQAP